jgi:uncharacterized protein (DUF1810 family)
MLDRFHQAQAGAGYATPLQQIREGEKRGHWIWYIFPQLDGLGQSSTARDYAIRDFAEACAYLRDPVLGKHYDEITAAVAEQLALDVNIEDLLGGSVDAMKLVSSLTLFRAAAKKLELIELANRCDQILQIALAQGYPSCEFTLEHCCINELRG